MSEIKTILLKSKDGLELTISSLGAAVLSLKVPNKKGTLTNVVVGLKTAEEYLTKKYLDEGLYLGASVGRYAGRISKGSFKINDKIHKVSLQNGMHLHGGTNGFDKKKWSVENVDESEYPSVTLSYLSKHLEEGYPGNLKVFVTYALIKNKALNVTYKATTDQTTVVNLTNHSYFNLSGEASILDHELQLNSSSYLDLDEKLIPSGKINSVEETRFDFRKKSIIGRKDFIGLDNTFVLNDEKLKVLISSKKTGIQMKVYSNQPAIVIFTSPRFKSLLFKDNVVYDQFPAICFEAQHFPDAPNNLNFPSTILKPNNTYINKTIFEFSTI